MLTSKKTNKLFYKKWPYKVRLRVENPHLWRSLEYWKHRAKVSGTNFSKDIAHLVSFEKHLQEIVKDQKYQVRSEGSRMSLFLDDRATFQKVLTEMKDTVIDCWEPESQESLSILLEKKNLILANKFPHGLYKFRVYLKESIKNKDSIRTWLEMYPKEKVKISRSTEYFLQADRNYVQAPNILVCDDKMLAMLYLSHNDKIKRVDEYVIKNSDK